MRISNIEPMVINTVSYINGFISVDDVEFTDFRDTYMAKFGFRLKINGVSTTINDYATMHPTGQQREIYEQMIANKHARVNLARQAMVNVSGP
jgi:hypothetical protein